MQFVRHPKSHYHKAGQTYPVRHGTWLPRSNMDAKKINESWTGQRGSCTSRCRQEWL